MEHKIGEVFNRKGKTLKIISAEELIYDNLKDLCEGCAYLKQGLCAEGNNMNNGKLEHCFSDYRKDKTSIIFSEVK